MIRPRVAPFAAALALSLLPGPAPAAERSFVGKKLPAVTFEDIEGHTIDPRHYAGSVLVMIAGIPW